MEVKVMEQGVFSCLLNGVRVTLFEMIKSLGWNVDLQWDLHVFIFIWLSFDIVLGVVVFFILDTVMSAMGVNFGRHERVEGSTG